MKHTVFIAYDLVGLSRNSGLFWDHALVMGRPQTFF